MPAPDQAAPDPAAPDPVALADRVAGLPPRCGRTVVVAVDGPSGAGKSTLADRLAGQLASLLAGRPALAPRPDDAPDGVALVRLDEVYPGWDGLDAAVPRVVDDLLRPLALGRPGTVRRWDWAAGREGVPRTVPVPAVLVLEGCGAGARACAPYLSLLVWLDGPEAVRAARALARDGGAYAPHWQRWAAQERRHFAREGTEARADVRYPVGIVGGPG